MGILSIDPITSWMCDEGFKNRNQGKVLQGANLKMKMLKYSDCIRVYEKFLIEFPKSSKKPIIYFRLGLCYEKNGKIEDAKTWYTKLEKEYPKHRWTDQAVKRMKGLEAQE